MECPDCGYQLTPFEKECPRCQNFKESAKNPYVAHQRRQALERQAKAPPPAPEPVNLPPPASQARPVQPAPEARPAPVLTEDMLACVVCGNRDVRNVPSIVDEGTWTQQSRGQMTGAAFDGQGHVMPVVGTTAATTHGATTLAQQLLPPARPIWHRASALSVTVALLGLFLSIVLAAGQGLTVGAVAAVVSVGLWAVAYAWEQDQNARRKEWCAEDTVRWGLVMEVWQRTFYCARCHHVYDPATGQAATAGSLFTLLPSFAPVERRLPARVWPRRLMAVLAIVAAVVFCVCVLVVRFYRGYFDALLQAEPSGPSAQSSTAPRPDNSSASSGGSLPPPILTNVPSATGSAHRRPTARHRAVHAPVRLSHDSGIPVPNRPTSADGLPVNDVPGTSVPAATRDDPYGSVPDNSVSDSPTPPPFTDPVAAPAAPTDSPPPPDTTDGGPQDNAQNGSTPPGF